jgi:homoserine O-acetyltransferase
VARGIFSLYFNYYSRLSVKYILMRQIVLFWLLIAGAITSSSQELKVINIGDLKLTSGAVLRDCKLSYRIFGKLNQAGTNAVLLPTFFNGSSEYWNTNVGKDRAIDTSIFMGIAVDAFGAGGSSSPSQWGNNAVNFPAVSIRDMVNAQYILLRDHLKIKSLHAVVGISMGGMQAFEWGIAYPGMAKYIIPVMGSPKLSAFDILVWQTFLENIYSIKKYNIPRDSASKQIARLYLMCGTTPAGVNSWIPPDSVDVTVMNYAKGFSGGNYDNLALQLAAMISHDVSKSFKGDMKAAQQAFKSKLLVVYSSNDHVVTPQSALAFAGAVSGDTLQITSDCGHQAVFCEATKINEAIRSFLVK